MRHLLIGMAIICGLWTEAKAQISYLDRPDLLEKAEVCLDHTYGFSFARARQIQKELASSTPAHPAPVFLESLIIYWENFPLTLSGEASGQFISLLDQTIELSAELLKDSLTYTEGVFFDLFGRAFKAMFWADNGKSGKVIPDLGNMYRYTREGFELQEHFVEFYFSTGLYNYYIEAYPEAHPAYKPFIAFMHKGDRKLGLQQLNYAINHTVFLKVEAILFMSIIQLKYENDINTASIYAERLVKAYPRNIFYQGHLIIILLHQRRFEYVRKMLAESVRNEDAFSGMIRTLAKAFLAEGESGQETMARNAYLETIDMAEEFGPLADLYQAMGYMGLSRLFERMGLEQESREYRRKAARLTSYDFILNETGAGPR